MNKQVFVAAGKPFAVLFSIEKPWRKYLFLARQTYGSTRWQELNEWAERLLLTMLRKYPSLLSPLTRYFNATGRGQAAAELAEHYQSINSSHVDWQLAAAEVWFQNKEYQRGDQALMHALRLAPESIEVLEFSAHIHKTRSNSFMELDALQSLLPLSEAKEKQQIMSRMVVPLFNFEKYQDVVQLFQDIVLAGQPWSNLYRYGVSLAKTGRTTESQTVLDQAANRAKLKAGDLNSRVAELHFRFQDYENVLEVLKGRPLAEESPHILRIAARAASFTSQYGEAARRYEALVLNNRASLQDYFEYGATLEHAERPCDAVDVYLRGARNATGTLKRELVFRAFSVMLRSGDYASATHHIEEHLELWSKRSTAFDKASEAELTSKFLAPTTQRELYSSAIALGRREIERGNLRSASHYFVDISDRLQPYIDPQGWQKQFSLTKNEYYLEQLDAPLLKNIVLVESFLARRISCNPFALLVEALQDPQYSSFSFVVAITPSTEIPEVLKQSERVGFVSRSSYAYRRLLARAEFLINNVTFPNYFVRRPDQKYLNTWHGVPWKYLGKDVEDHEFAYGNVIKNMIVATHLALPDKHTAEVLTTRQGIAPLLNGKVAITGSARVDVTLNYSPERREKLRNSLLDPSMAPGTQIILFAPTWREWQEQERDPGKSFRAIVDKLSQTFPHLLIAVRAHHFLEAAIEDLGELKNVVVVPNTIDTNELIAVTDFLISDYSSIIFDFAVTGKPVLKLVEDIERYRNERGLYFDEKEIPGLAFADIQSLCETLDLLVHGKEYQNDANEFIDFEDGKAATRTLNFFFKDSIEDSREYDVGAARDKPRVLLSVSGLNPNGITRSLQSLVANLSQKGIRTFLLIYPEVLRNPAIAGTIENLEKFADIIPGYNHVFSSRSERSMGRYYYSGLGKRQIHADSIIARQMRREFRRQFGDAEFEAVVEFDGYNPTRTLLTAFGSPESHRIHVFHNDFRKEAGSRFPRLRSAMMVVNSYDVVGSVSDTVREENVSFLKDYGADSSRHLVIRNTLDLQFLEDESGGDLDPDLEAWFAETPHSRVAIMVGRISPEKNHEMMIHAMSRLAQQGDANLRILVLGDGPLRLKYEQLLKELSLDDRVFFAGHRSNPYPAIMRSDAMFLPSLYEGQPIVLLEALVLGVPVVATDIPGSRAVLNEGTGGTLVDVSFAGVLNGLRTISSGSLQPVEFDASHYNEEVTNEFIDLLQGSSPGGIQRNNWSSVE